MIKKTRSRLSFSQRLRSGLIVFALIGLGWALLKQVPTKPNSIFSHQQSEPTTLSDPAKPQSEVIATTPTPPAKSKPAPKRIRTIARPQPVVKPSPAASVDSLTPTSPTQTSSGSYVTSGYLSTNWSGYFAVGSGFTSVSGSWKATSVAGLPGVLSADSTWIGIGGVTTSDLIQTGTMNIVEANGTVHPAAFYEILPAAAVIIPSLPVNPGDNMTATITETSPNFWNVSISNLSTGKSFTINLNYNSSRSSAEWIEEAPSYGSGEIIPLANYQTATFTNGYAVKNGASRSIAANNSVPVTMVDGTGKIISAVSALSANGAGFTATRVGL